MDNFHLISYIFHRKCLVFMNAFKTAKIMDLSGTAQDTWASMKTAIIIRLPLLYFCCARISSNKKGVLLVTWSTILLNLTKKCMKRKKKLEKITVTRAFLPRWIWIIWGSIIWIVLFFVLVAFCVKHFCALKFNSYCFLLGVAVGPYSLLCPHHW